MFKRIRSERGFTLIELLVVLAIMAILIAIVVPNLAGITGGARKTAAQTEWDIVQTAIDTLMSQKEAMSVAGTSCSPKKVGPSTKPTYWYVYKVDPDGKEHITGAADTALTLRVTSTGTYEWTGTGLVTQTLYGD